MRAVIQISGQQYIVQKGDEITVDRLPSDTSKLSFVPLLLIDESNVQVGTPNVVGAEVKADIIDATKKGDKVSIIKFQAKKRVKKLTGHRQPQTTIKITNITSK